MIDIADLRLVNVVLSLMVVGVQSYRLMSEWNALVWRVRLIVAAQTAFMAVVAYGSWRTWQLDFPPADYVWMVSLSLLVLLLALLAPRRRR